jgi:hypothetical protein
MQALTITDDTKRYFRQPDSPQERSPVGRLIVRILEKYPEMACEDARIEASRLLNIAAKGRVYRFPQIRSAEEKAASFASLAKLASARKFVLIGA